MSTTAASTRKRFSTRRKAFLALIVAALVVLAWMQYVGMAGISGMPTKDMDWNADGTVTQQEILESFYAVGVTRTTEGQRSCSGYYWRKDQQPIRVDCRTEMAPAKDAKE